MLGCHMSTTWSRLGCHVRVIFGCHVMIGCHVMFGCHIMLCCHVISWSHVMFGYHVMLGCQLMLRWHIRLGCYVMLSCYIMFGCHVFFQYEPIIKQGNEPFLHHMILYACWGAMSEEEGHHGTQYRCYRDRMPYDANCVSSMFAWAIGSKVRNSQKLKILVFISQKLRPG